MTGFERNHRDSFACSVEPWPPSNGQYSHLGDQESKSPEATIRRLSLQVLKVRQCE